MISSICRRALAVLAIGALIALSAGPSFAEVAVGDEAPAIEGKDFFNTEPVTFDDLRGRMIFVEFFATT